MSYKRMEVQDHVTVMNKQLYDNLQDGIDEDKEQINTLNEADTHTQGALDVLNKTVGYTKKNLIPYPYYNTTMEKDGMIITDNEDGTVTVNGEECLNSIYFIVQEYSTSTIKLKRGKYILNGCPQGGTPSTYNIYVTKADSEGNTEAIVFDYGEGAEFTIEEDDTIVGVSISISKGMSADNLVFKPMIRDARIKDGSYEPYEEDIDTRFGNMQYSIDNLKDEVANTVIPKYLTFSLNTPGWYRIAKIECGDLSEAQGSLSNSCEIEIKRNYNAHSTEYKKIKLVSIFKATGFADEISKNYSKDTNLFTKIRHTVDDVTNIGYIEVYYTSSSRNNSIVTISNYTNYNNKMWELIEPIVTEETVENVEILGSHSFNLNTTKVCGAEPIYVDNNITSTTEWGTNYTYTATRKCIVTLSITVFYNNGIPKAVQILKSGNILSQFSDNPHSSNQLQSISTMATYMLNPGESMVCQSQYTTAGNTNWCRISGVVQYLE